MKETRGRKKITDRNKIKQQKNVSLPKFVWLYIAKQKGNKNVALLSIIEQHVNNQIAKNNSMETCTKCDEIYKNENQNLCNDCK